MEGEEELKKFIQEHDKDIRRHALKMEVRRMNCKKCNMTGVYGYRNGNPIWCTCMAKLARKMTPQGFVPESAVAE